MKKLVMVIVLVLSLQSISAISSDLKSEYQPRETIIGELFGVLATVQKEQVKLVKDGHIDVAFEFDVGKIGSRHYIWLIAPQNSGNYTLRLEDVVAVEQGIPQVLDYEIDFSVQGAQTDYSIKPGFVVTNKDFKITATLYEDVSKTIDVDFPSQRSVPLLPGNNQISFSIANVIGTQEKIIKVGKYNVPVLIFGVDSICGDGNISGYEVCDGSNLNSKTCQTIPGNYIAGNLSCSSTCFSFDISGCKLTLEKCDSAHLNLCTTPTNCTNVGGYWYDNRCNSSPQSVVCNNENLNLCTNQSACANANGFWYNNSCNRYEQGATCDSQHVGLCTTPGTCLDSGGYWYDNRCNQVPQQTCGRNNVTLCNTPGTCLDANGYWYDNRCNSNPEPFCGDGVIQSNREICDCGNNECTSEELGGNNCTTIPSSYVGGSLLCSNNCLFFNESSCELPLPFTLPSPIFRFEPGIIRSTILIGDEIPSYRFSIVNNGMPKIENMLLDYDRNRFTISPDENITIEPNESKSFELTVNERVSNKMRGAVVAYTPDETFEYLTFTIEFTRDVEDVGTEYFRNRTSNLAYYCEELENGKFCSADETCTTSEVSTLDGLCCTGRCESPGSYKKYIGYLIIGILLLILLIIFVKYRKTRQGTSPTAKRFAMAEKTLP